MRTLSMLVVVGLLISTGLVVAADDKPKPRTQTAAEKREIQKERKAKLKEREDRAKANAKEHQDLAAKIRAKLEPWEEKGLTGCVLVAKDGKVIFKQGYGFADREAKRKNTPETIYDACAITTVVTAMAVLKLEMAGKLSLNDPLKKFFKDAPDAVGKVTLTQLLSHTSGITYDTFIFKDVEYNDRDSVLKRILDAPLVHEPGSAALESGMNYIVAAAIIEIASGRKYQEYIRKEILDPAGMKESDTCPAPKLDSKRSAVRHNDGNRLREVVGFPANWTMFGAECLATTADDLWRLNEAIDWTDILDKEARAAMFSEPLRWRCLPFVKDPAGSLGSRYTVAGGALGARAHFDRYPDKDIAVFVLINIPAAGRSIEREVAAEIQATLSEGS